MMQSQDGLPRHVVVAGAEDQLRKAGWKVQEAPDDEPLTAGDLATMLYTGICTGTIDPTKPLLLEDPNIMRPWEVRGVRTHDDQLILDVWGE